MKDPDSRKLEERFVGRLDQRHDDEPNNEQRKGRNAQGGYRGLGDDFRPSG